MSRLWRTPIVGKAVFAVWRADASRKTSWVSDWLSAGHAILEVGSGPGSVLKVLRDDDHDVVGLDVQDTSYSPDLAPIVYDRETIPFDDSAFDVALLLTVLHHAHDPDRLIGEAARVARRVIVIEDIYESAAQRRLTKIADSITNLEFFGHPHNNRDDAGWRAAFDRLGLTVVHGEKRPFAGLFLQALYVLERRESG